MFQSGNFVAEYVTELDGSRVSQDDITTHGVELGVDEIYRLQGPSFISNGGYVKPNRDEVPTRKTGDAVPDASDGIEADVVRAEHYTLNRGNFVVKYDKKITIPDDTVAFVFPRSRLMRSGLHVTTAVWDSGYEGVGEGGLYVDNQCFLEADTNIAQMVMCRADVVDEYDGSHQRERLDD